MLAVTIAALLGAAAAVAMIARNGGIRSSGTLAHWLRLACCLVVVLAIFVVGPIAAADSAGFAAVAVAVPLALSLLPLAAEATARGVTITTWICALGLMTWAVLLGLGVGLYFAPAALLLLGAAASQDSRSQRRRPVRH